MRIQIFAEAIRLQEYLEKYGSTHNKIHFKFTFPNEDEILTNIKIKENKTLLTCTCKHGSIHYEALCSHKLAVIFFLFKKQLKRLKLGW